MLCFLYTITVSACLACAGLLVERALPPGRPRRWIWCVTIALSMLIPPLYRARHMAVVDSAPAGADVSWMVRIGAFDPIIMKVWAVTSALIVLWGLASLWRVSVLVRRARDRNHAGLVVDGVPVALTDSLGPATVGLWKSHVVIPRWVLALPATQREYVLRHEDEHRKAHDTHLLFFSSLVLVLAPWNVALHWQLRRLSLAVEMDCDRRVVSALGGATTYGELLLNIAAATNHTPRLQPGFLGIGSLERRLTELVAPARISRAQQLLLPLLAMAVLVAVLLTPHPRADGGQNSQHSAAHAAP